MTSERAHTYVMLSRADPNDEVLNEFQVDVAVLHHCKLLHRLLLVSFKRSLCQNIRTRYESQLNVC